MNGVDILKLKMGDNDANAETVKDYLKKLLETLWQGGEGFSGKRPFGNSGWDRELHKPLLVAELVEGDLDDEGCINTIDEDEANILIFEAIKAL